MRSSEQTVELPGQFQDLDEEPIVVAVDFRQGIGVPPFAAAERASQAGRSQFPIQLLRLGKGLCRNVS